MKKQTKQTNEKRFNLEKMEVVKLTTMKKIVGGQGGGDSKTTDDGTITDLIFKVSNFCI